MKTPRLILGIATSASLLSLIQTASAADVTDPNDPRSWQGATVGTFAQLYYGSDTLANRQLVVDNHLLNDGVFNFAGATAAPLIQTTGIFGTGTSTGVGPGDYSYFGGFPDATTAGSTIDATWVQNGSVIGGSIWDLLAPSTKAAIFPTIDHGPLPQESIESTVYLSNDKVTWTEAVVQKVWLEGFQTTTEWDGFVYAVGTPGNTQFRYATIINGGPGALMHDGDDEINGVMGLDVNFNPTTGVPDGGSTIIMLSSALLALGGMARKHARS